uniref:Tetratricopeptide repeat protein n=1 Tax=Timema tahoe TaxID=61484 RepID=A0A7R9INS5_9NEOP|nr:unnamed protein product [Timema tahoe]
MDTHNTGSGEQSRAYTSNVQRAIVTASQRVQLTATYAFEDDNPLKLDSRALEEGKKKLKAGDLPSAVLCFEAAVQQEPNNALAWELLGMTQAENERFILFATQLVDPVDDLAVGMFASLADLSLLSLFTKPYITY